jgi:hypothetical protein
MRKPATDEIIRHKAMLVVDSYPTMGAAWTHITSTAWVFLKESNYQATAADIERVVKAMNLTRRVIDGEERFFKPKRGR